MGKKINLDKMSRQTQLVGYIRNEIIEQLELSINTKEIIIYPGVIKHIRERHPYTFRKYFHKLVEIIRSPDYIGAVYKDYHRIEFIKNYKDNILVALKVEENSPIFISSMYIITENAIEKRIETGKLHPIHLSSEIDVGKKQYKNIKRYKQ
ncbi:PBECR3 domain-containing polyvalent protein [Cellulosilyticum sp. I15G10I2]|uniref:PBECR3 domain-containing polyvalent protein n=1 Tax=Cellulosilyticum sp. I15G10I2 TaxID=1892843 RepID=UPI00085C8725|nr:PBECR2 nuclease fold domain-containing protein [Cellulosilyticum sp. I15G10I2]